MPVTRGQGQSDMTEIKQRDYQEFLTLWLTFVKNALRSPRYRKTIIYIDTNAGSGYNAEFDCPGSPVIFCEEMEKADIPYLAYLIEKRQDYCQELRARVKPFNAEVFNGDNQEELPLILDRLPHSSLGLMYIDPNGIPDWKIVNQASSHPKIQTVDILIRYNTNAVWRNHHNGYHLESDIDNLKKKFRWGKEYYPFDKWSWSFLLGMNYPYGDWQSKGWKRLDTEAGLNLLERLADSPNQRQKKRQIALTGLMENTCNTPRIELSERKSSGGLVGYVKGAIKGRLRKYIT